MRGRGGTFTIAEGGDFRALFLKTEQLNERKSLEGQQNDFKINM